MKNLNEEINRIKKIIHINEQCESDLEQCAADLERQEYKVFSPEDLKTTCEENTLIKCVNDSLSSNDITDITISSVGDSTRDCYLLAKSKEKVSGLSGFMITFYGDNQVVIEVLLGSKNNNDILLYRSNYRCDTTEFEVKGGTPFKYIGIKKSGSAEMVNKDIINQNNGEFMMVNSAEAGTMGISAGVLTGKDYLTYYLNKMVGYIGNVKKKGLTTEQIVKILTH